MQNDKVLIKGMEVQKYYYSDEEPMITHGVFQIQNNTKVSEEIVINKVSCVIGKNIFPISKYFIYKLPDYIEINDRTIKVPPIHSLKVEISFSFFSALSHLNEDIFIEIVIEMKGEKTTIKSPYTLGIRTKKQLD